MPEPELTFSGRRGSEVLSPKTRRPCRSLRVGRRVLVPSLFGYYLATVCFTGKNALAETETMFFPLQREDDGAWWCYGSCTKEAATGLWKALSQLESLDSVMARRP